MHTIFKRVCRDTNCNTFMQFFENFTGKLPMLTVGASSFRPSRNCMELSWAIQDLVAVFHSIMTPPKPEKRVVRILLKCFLVFKTFYTSSQQRQFQNQVKLPLQYLHEYCYLINYFQTSITIVEDPGFARRMAGKGGGVNLLFSQMFFPILDLGSPPFLLVMYVMKTAIMDNCIRKPCSF